MDREAYLKMMSGWIDAAKNCSQLAIAAMFLPVFYARQYQGIAESQPLSANMPKLHIASWILLLVTVATSVIYQFTASKLIQSYLSGSTSGLLFPRFQFWMMSASLISGILCFVLGSL